VNLVESFDISRVYDKRQSHQGCQKGFNKDKRSLLDISTGNSQSDMMLLSALQK
jgi:hypothetical protein